MEYCASKQKSVKAHARHHKSTISKGKSNRGTENGTYRSRNGIKCDNTENTEHFLKTITFCESNMQVNDDVRGVNLNKIEYKNKPNLKDFERTTNINSPPSANICNSSSCASENVNNINFEKCGSSPCTHENDNDTKKNTFDENNRNELKINHCNFDPRVNFLASLTSGHLTNWFKWIANCYKLKTLWKAFCNYFFLGVAHNVKIQKDTAEYYDHSKCRESIKDEINSDRKNENTLTSKSISTIISTERMQFTRPVGPSMHDELIIKSIEGGMGTEPSRIYSDKGNGTQEQDQANNNRYSRRRKRRSSCFEFRSQETGHFTPLGSPSNRHSITSKCLAEIINHEDKRTHHNDTRILAFGGESRSRIEAHCCVLGNVKRSEHARKSHSWDSGKNDISRRHSTTKRLSYKKSSGSSHSNVSKHNSEIKHHGDKRKNIKVIRTPTSSRQNHISDDVHSCNQGECSEHHIVSHSKDLKNRKISKRDSGIRQYSPIRFSSSTHTVTLIERKDYGDKRNNSKRSRKLIVCKRSHMSHADHSSTHGEHSEIPRKIHFGVTKNSIVLSRENGSRRLSSSGSYSRSHLVVSKNFFGRNYSREKRRNAKDRTMINATNSCDKSVCSSNSLRPHFNESTPNDNSKKYNYHKINEKEIRTFPHPKLEKIIEYSKRKEDVNKDYPRKSPKSCTEKYACRKGSEKKIYNENKMFSINKYKKKLNRADECTSQHILSPNKKESKRYKKNISQYGIYTKNEMPKDTSKHTLKRNRPQVKKESISKRNSFTFKQKSDYYDYRDKVNLLREENKKSRWMIAKNCANHHYPKESIQGIRSYSFQTPAPIYTIPYSQHSVHLPSNSSQQSTFFNIASRFPSHTTQFQSQSQSGTQPHIVKPPPASFPAMRSQFPQFSTASSIPSPVIIHQYPKTGQIPKQLSYSQYSHVAQMPFSIFNPNITSQFHTSMLKK